MTPYYITHRSLPDQSNHATSQFFPIRSHLGIILDWGNNSLYLSGWLHIFIIIFLITKKRSSLS